MSLCHTLSCPLIGPPLRDVPPLGQSLAGIQSSVYIDVWIWVQINSTQNDILDKWLDDLYSYILLLLLLYIKEWILHWLHELGIKRNIIDAQTGACAESILFAHSHGNRNHTHNVIYGHTVEPLNKRHAGNNAKSRGLSFIEGLSSTTDFQM